MKRIVVVFLIAGGIGCGGGASPTAPVAATPPATPTPAPTPTPTPQQGAVAFLSASVPAGSTVAVFPLSVNGQQASSLTFRYAVRLEAATQGALTRVWVRNATTRCLGAGFIVDLKSAEPKEMVSLPLSFNSGTDAAPCRLPFTTTGVEISVARDGIDVVSQTFPMNYSFVAGN